MKLSIFVVTYNQEKFIRQCLDSILMQTVNFDYEVIIGEDCSTDKTPDICDEYAARHSNIHVFHHLKNLGLVKNWEFVLNHCQGQYIAMIEGDDYWIDENKLQMQTDFLERNPEYTMCFHSAKILNELESVTNTDIYKKLENRDYSPSELFQSWTVPTAAIVMKKECLFYQCKDSNFLYGDIKTVESCAHMGKIRGFHSDMSVYRIQQNGLTWDKSKDYQRFLKLPNHFKAVKNSFPLIHTALVNDKIVESYLLCALKCGNILQKILWCFMAFFTSPVAFGQNIKKYIERKL
mgnify:CR=1 FL=1